ncbi:hypothetical protein [Haematobacter genomosp. 1]|uniref:Uncharacterized protein n=1 Tax=Haematobacter genomosp. 1 TaxID=366618 RepID=A0A212AFN3_9RHOB|nr:hypothetical protein [Haematobacter genomosp. 1]OWJ80322.1 hypothetical protein CDV49_03365 [Haematobacter genomosp. 1]
MVNDFQSTTGQKTFFSRLLSATTGLRKPRLPCCDDPRKAPSSAGSQPDMSITSRNHRLNAGTV